ncbi:transcriptional regulator of RNA polII, SAGA, subunit-domain-containing protein [Glomus cerebriforme]|uniref:Transcriptional regulator of RNA polII, SAGA, subunit-domain-containing protein n=1 Tax=Glomus cerebriforme TaxID=658196 RepID=A0A397SSN2_9GLOM|nr:transcriptional regulator of RNA polII, SAGA, subunit-domain-containing protein [Glomus cerebriforme]
MSNKEKTFKKRKFIPSPQPSPSKIISSSLTPTSCSLWSAHQQRKEPREDQKIQIITPIITSTELLPINSTIPQTVTTPEISSNKKAAQVDPISLKNSLDEALEVNKEKYWLLIQSFIKGEINKNELDFYVHSLLPKEHVHLHDEFIRASIKLKNTRRYQDDVKNVTFSASSSQKEKFLKKIMSSMGKEERDKLHVILESAQNNQGIVHTNSNLMLFEKKFPKYTTIDEDFVDLPTLTPPSLTTLSSINEEEDGFSEFNSVYTKMTEIALDNGLICGVTEDCANLMIYALETHLKNIVHSCINKIRSNEFHDETEKISNSPISLRDLAFSLEISPYILVNNNFILEKILVKINQKL